MIYYAEISSFKPFLILLPCLPPVEWETKEDHTDRWMKSPEYGPFAELMFTLLDPDKAIVSMTHAYFHASPAALPSAERPVLEVFQMQLPSSNKEDQDKLSQLFKPITRLWTSQARAWVEAPIVDEGMQDRAMFVVAWESKEAHYESKKEQAYQQAIVKARAMWKTVNLFGHIKATIVRA